MFRGRIKVLSTIASYSPLNISETVRVEREREDWFGHQVMTNGESNGHVADDVT